MALEGTDVVLKVPPASPLLFSPQRYPRVAYVLVKGVWTSLSLFLQQKKEEGRRKKGEEEERGGN